MVSDSVVKKAVTWQVKILLYWIPEIFDQELLESPKSLIPISSPLVAADKSSIS